MAEVTLAAANLVIGHNKATNLKRFLEVIEEAASKDVDVLVLPEVGLQGYPDFGIPHGSKEAADQRRYYHYEAETIPGPSTEAIRDAAKRHGMFVQLGLAEVSPVARTIFNATALIGPNGVVGSYRKIHNQFEFPYFYPGEDARTFETPFGKAASLICYDLCFPELIRRYALEGTDVVLMSNGWPMLGRDRSNDYYGWAMDVAAQANAFFNQVWLVVSNHCQRGRAETDYDYYGGSQIVAPSGRVVAYLAEEEGLVTHTADLADTILESRTNAFFGANLLQDRRPEHYAPLADLSFRHPSPAAEVIDSDPRGHGDPLATAPHRSAGPRHEPSGSRT